MKQTWMKVTAGTALAAGMMLAQATTPAPTPAPQPGQGRHHHMRMDPQQRFDRMATYLNLTPDQRQQAQTLMQQAKTEAQPVMAQLKTTRQQLAEAVKSGNEAEIQRLATQQGDLQGQLIAIRAKALEKGYAMLNPDQRQKADQLQQKMQSRFGHKNGARMNGSRNNG